MPKKINPPFVLGTNFGRLRIGSYREDGSKYLMDAVKDLLETGCHVSCISQETEIRDDDDYYIYYNIDFYKENQ